MNIDDIETIFIAVQLKSGGAHQVLTTKENKEIALRLIGSADGGLKLDKELEPLTFEYK